MALLQTRADRAPRGHAIPAAGRWVRQAALLLALVLCGGLSQAQSHEKQFGQYLVRASAVTGAVLPESTRRAHEIEISPARGLLNVVIVLPALPANPTVPSKVEASVTNLLGQTEKLEMRAIRENGGVSYLGTFTFVPGQTMRFTIEVTPEGSTKSTTLQFDDRFFVSRNRYIQPASGWM